jgi:hypothetical protein
MQIADVFHSHKLTATLSAAIHAASLVAVRVRFGPSGGPCRHSIGASKDHRPGHSEPHAGSLATMAILSAGLEE